MCKIVRVSMDPDYPGVVTLCGKPFLWKQEITRTTVLAPIIQNGCVAVLDQGAMDFFRCEDEIVGPLSVLVVGPPVAFLDTMESFLPANIEYCDTDDLPSPFGPREHQDLYILPCVDWKDLSWVKWCLEIIFWQKEARVLINFAEEKEGRSPLKDIEAFLDDSHILVCKNLCLAGIIENAFGFLQASRTRKGVEIH